MDLALPEDFKRHFDWENLANCPQAHHCTHPEPAASFLPVEPFKDLHTSESLFPDETFSYGKIEIIYESDTDAEIDEAITLMARDVGEHGAVSLIGQTYIFDPYSQAATDLFIEVAKAQRRNPAFEFVLIVNTLSSPQYAEIIQRASLYGVSMRLGKYSNQLGRGSLHSKSWVLDGTHAYLGGDNVDNKAENDYMVCFRGPIVRRVEDDLLDAWNKAGNYESSEGLPDLMVEEIIARGLSDQIPLTEMYPIATLSKEGIGWFGDYYENDADRGILAAINGAKESIQIMGPNMNDAKVLEALCAAAERGVKVQALLPKGYQRVQSWVDRATNSAPLIYRSRLSSAAAARFKIRFYSHNKETLSASHSKFYGIDGKIAVVGSQNPDNQSFRFSREFNLAVCEKQGALLLRNTLFDSHWGTSLIAPEKLWHRLAPIPGKKSWERIARYILYPVEFAQNLFRQTGWKTGAAHLFKWF